MDKKYPIKVWDSHRNIKKTFFTFPVINELLEKGKLKFVTYFFTINFNFVYSNEQIE